MRGSLLEAGKQLEKGTIFLILLDVVLLGCHLESWSPSCCQPQNEARGEDGRVVMDRGEVFSDIVEPWSQAALESHTLVLGGMMVFLIM